ncbi:MAG: aromatic amino acid DMT transporter YddG [Eggerthellales bacterium]|nr:aromatic amino acid DMT transporter YddG [Eggerthellales bacterium]
MTRVSKQKATIIGIMAVFFWAAMIGFMRLTSEAFGPTLGPALIYTLSALGLLIVRTPKNIRKMPRKYLLIGGILMVYVEIASTMAIVLASSSKQTIEIGIVNYLWPTLTVLLFVATSKNVKPTWLIVPGTLLATGGVVCAVGGDGGLDIASIMGNISSNPLPYLLAFSGAIAWAAYSVITPAMSEGHDGLTLFFIATAVAFWALFLVTGCIMPEVTPQIPDLVPLIVTAVILTAGYACWNFGIIYGDLGLMSTVSYAAPVLSSLSSSIILATTLSLSFWLSAAAVAVGSLMSYFSTKPKSDSSDSDSDGSANVELDIRVEAEAPAAVAAE